MGSADPKKIKTTKRTLKNFRTKCQLKMGSSQNNANQSINFPGQHTLGKLTGCNLFIKGTEVKLGANTTG